MTGSLILTSRSRVRLRDDSKQPWTARDRRREFFGVPRQRRRSGGIAVVLSIAWPAVLVGLLYISVGQASEQPGSNVSSVSPGLVSEKVLSKLRTILSEQREHEHITGLALVVVKDDKVAALETLGLRDRARKLPVTPETVFPIGSCTKSFTAIAAAESHDRGTLSIDDSPHKFLPYFHMADPQADALITLRDMLCHRSGLRAYADLAAEPAVLTREEYVRAATSAKPTARFRAQFQYSNAMFTAAGEAIAKANQTTWERLIETRIFGPLGMTSSRTSAEVPSGAADHALGYVFQKATKDWKQVPPPKSLAALAPAGAIVSSARDVGQWLRFLTAGGILDGKRIVAETTLRDVTAPHIKISDSVSYALGWVTYRWNDNTVVEHNGGSQGISALVSYIPSRRIGFAFLANASPNYMTSIGNAGRLLWPLLLEEKESPAPSKPKQTTDAPAPPITPSAAPPLPSVVELLARIIAAHGGERNLRRHSSIEVHAHKRYENQGVESDLVIKGSAPASRTEDEAWTAAGKPIGRLRTYFDGTRGGQETTFGQDATYTADESDKANRTSALHAILDLRRLYSEIKIRREDTVDGESAFVLQLRPKSGSPVKLFASSRTFLIIRQEIDSETTTFGDYRNVDGEFVAFRTTIRDALGETTIAVKNVQFNGTFAPATFGPEVHRGTPRQ
jgi:CubicO group peptidase (beta-lactamase class C family)